MSVPKIGLYTDVKDTYGNLVYDKYTTTDYFAHVNWMWQCGYRKMNDDQTIGFSLKKKIFHGDHDQCNDHRHFHQVIWPALHWCSAATEFKMHSIAMTYFQEIIWYAQTNAATHARLRIDNRKWKWRLSIAVRALKAEVLITFERKEIATRFQALP